MKHLCDARKRSASDELELPGDYFIVEKRGLSDEEFLQLTKALKAKLEPKNVFSRLYWKIFIRKPVEETPKYLHAMGHLRKKKSIWPAFRALLIVCPFCKVPFSSHSDQKILIDDPLHLEDELMCPYSRDGKKIVIRNGKFYEQVNSN